MARKVKGIKQEFYFITNHQTQEEKDDFYQYEYWPVVRRVMLNSFNETEQVRILNGLDKYQEEIIQEVISTLE